jgi:hypothetical protein
MKLVTCLACDLIRVEDSGKLLLIGVYQELIFVKSFPVRLPLSFHITLDATGERWRSAKLEFRLSQPGKPTHLTMSPVDVGISEESGILNFNLQGLPVQLDTAGRLTLSYRRDGGRWTSLRSWEVRLAEVSPPIPNA